VVRKQQI